jgi:hypothetical protein
MNRGIKKGNGYQLSSGESRECAAVRGTIGPAIPKELVVYLVVYLNISTFFIVLGHFVNYLRI